MVNLDEASLRNLLKQQQARYKALVKEIKAKKLQADPNVLLDEIKETNDKAVELFRKVISNPENMDQRFNIDDLMRYMSYAYEQFYKSMKSKRDSDKSIERAKQRAKEKGKEFDEEEFRKWNYDQSSSDEYIRDSKEYLQKVKKMIEEIEENIK
jgi:adenylosuccinate lyase